MRKPVRITTLLGVLGLTACVTINIYFPAEEVKDAADKIVNEVWGERTGRSETDEAAPPAEPGGGDNSFRLLLEPRRAYAAQDINVSTPEIRAIRESMKERSQALFRYLDSGHVGVGANGFLKLRTADGLDLRSRGEANRLIAAENKDRERLYEEIARANGFPDRVGEVQAIFADSWREQAAQGWQVEEKDGSWTVKR